MGIEDEVRGHQESGEFGEHVAYIGFWRLACSLVEQGLLISYLIKIKGNCFFLFSFASIWNIDMVAETGITMLGCAEEGVRDLLCP